MKIVLVNPLWTRENILPTNLAELAGYIREQGYPDITMVDLNYELRNEKNIDIIIERAIEIIQNQKPDIIGITCNTIHVPFCAELCREYKKRYKTPITLGGIHPTFRPNKMFELSKADYIVRGEGEQTFLELLNALNNKERVDNILGLSFKRKKIYHNPDRPFINDLTILPFPAYDLLLPYVNQTTQANFEIDNLNLSASRVNLSASRGCPFGCIFCSVNKMWGCQRKKSLTRVLEEIKYIKEIYRHNYIEFSDNCLTLDKEWFDSLLDGIKKLNVNWSCLTRIDMIDRKLIRDMKASGCTHIYHGIESGNARIRRILGKKLLFNTTNNTIAKLIKEELRVGIKPKCSFITGVPTETKEEMEETINFALALKKLGAEIQLHIMTPYPGIEANRIYENRLIKINRWRISKNATELNLYGQFELYYKFYDKYNNENPDFYMFKPNMELKDFFKLYNEGTEKLSESIFYDERLFNYVKENRPKKYFVSINKKHHLEGMGTKRKNSNILIRIERPFNKLDGIVNKLKNLNPKNCFLSIKIKKADLSLKLRRKILSFLIALKNNDIKFHLTRPFPSNFFSRSQHGFKKQLKMPINCKDCAELFKVNRKGKIELCTGRELYKKEYALNRRHIYDAFIKMVMFESRNKVKSCISFPEKEILEWLDRKNKIASFYLKKAMKHFSQGAYNAAIKFAWKARKSDYDEWNLDFLLGLCYKKKEKFNIAIKELKKAEEKNPNNENITFAIAECYKKRGDSVNALLEIKKGFVKYKYRHFLT